MLSVYIFIGCTAPLRPVKVSEYCLKISGTQNPDSAGVRACMEQEHIAEHKLSGMTIPWEIERYCRKISESTGKSYQVMLTCVEEELSE